MCKKSKSPPFVYYKICWSCMTFVDHAMRQLLIMYHNCWSYYERLLIICYDHWSCCVTLLIMHDDMLIIAMKRLLFIHDVWDNHVIMKVIVTTNTGWIRAEKKYFHKTCCSFFWSITHLILWFLGLHSFKLWIFSFKFQVCKSGFSLNFLF